MRISQRPRIASPIGRSLKVVVMFVIAMSWQVASHAQTFDKRDLQGTWTNATITAFERPAAFANKEFLTEQEVKEAESRAADNRVDRAPQTGDVGNYNQFWFDSGTKVVKS